MSPVYTNTNDLLAALQVTLEKLNAATQSVTDAGIPNAPLMPFFRMGEPYRVPVSQTSGPNQFPSTGTLTLPTGATTFRIANNNPFAVRLKGTKQGQTLQAVTSTTGWLFMPGAVEVYTTTQPILLSAMSVDGPFAMSDPSQAAGVGFLELQYGTGA